MKGRPVLGVKSEISLVGHRREFRGWMVCLWSARTRYQGILFHRVLRSFVWHKSRYGVYALALMPYASPSLTIIQMPARIIRWPRPKNPVWVSNAAISSRVTCRGRVLEQESLHLPYNKVISPYCVTRYPVGGCRGILFRDKGPCFGFFHLHGLTLSLSAWSFPMVSGFLFGETSNIRDRGIIRLPEWFFSTENISANIVTGFFIKDSFFTGFIEGKRPWFGEIPIGPWTRLVKIDVW